MSQSIVASGPNVTGKKYVGVNLQTVTYYDNELSFINMFKQASTNTNDGYTMIDTFTAAGNQQSGTHESGDVDVDVNGYAKSMTGKSGQAFTKFRLVCMTNCGGYYPGPYRLTFSGQGVITAISDITGLVSISNTGTGARSTISGKTVTAFANAGVTSVVFNATYVGGGLGWEISSLPLATDNIRNMSMCQDALADAYLAGGSIFHPNFLSSLNGYSRIRFMDWLQSMRQSVPLWKSAAQGATSLVIGAWDKPTGDYKMTFSNGQQMTVGCIFNSTTMDFKGIPLTNAVTQEWLTLTKDWASRPKATDFSYATDRGVPIEVCAQLCEELGIDFWQCLPITMDSDPTYLPGLAKLLHNGVGSTLPAFTGCSKRIFLEPSNEIWNSANNGGSYPEWGYANALGLKQFPAAGGQSLAQANWIGTQVAAMGDAFYSEFALGNEAAFRAKVCVLMPGQTAGDATYVKAALNSTSWTSRAYTHHIGGVALAPYMSPSFSGNLYLETSGGVVNWLNGKTAVHILWSNEAAGPYTIVFSDGEVKQATLTIAGSTKTMSWTGALTGSPTADASIKDQAVVLQQPVPLDVFFGCAYSRTYNGITYPSIDVNGWAGAQVAWATTEIASINTGNPWGALEIHGYESGTQISPGMDGLFTWNVLMAGGVDNRMEYVYHDPTNQLFTQYGIASANGKPGFMQACANAGFTSLNHFNHCQPQSKWGEFGTFTSMFQSLVPLSSAPPKHRGVMKYAGLAASVAPPIFSQPTNVAGLTGNIFLPLADTVKPANGQWAMTGWQINPYGGTPPIFVPSNWNASIYTGFAPSGGLSSQYSYRNQAGSTTAQMEGDTVAAYLNSSELVSSVGSKIMITPNYAFLTNIYPWITDNFVVVSLMLKVPVATDAHVANSKNYINMDLKWFDQNGFKISMSSKLFDNGHGQNVGPTIAVDAPSNSTMVNSPLYGTGQKYLSMDPASNNQLGTPWTTFKLFKYRISKAQFALALTDIIAAYPGTTMSLNPADYYFDSFHLNAESTWAAGATTMGWAMKGLTIGLEP